MLSYRCPTCGKSYDAEKTEICPACGAAVAPSVLTRIERKTTAARLRAEGMTHYDDHCHEDDAWKGSYGAQTHRAAVQSHEAQLRAGYRAHSEADVTTRGNPTPVAPAARTQARKKPTPGIVKFLLPLSIILVYILFRILFSILAELRAFGGISFP